LVADEKLLVGYNVVVSTAEKILSAALELSTRDRARVAHELLRSLDEALDEDAAEAWTEELRRRLRQVRDGEVEPLSLDEVKRRIAERRAARRAAR
jgi:putative addiction module component (TIGR02574 family)